MQSMTREWAGLELENYEAAFKDAEIFVKWIISKGLFNKSRLLSGEGSASAMVDTTLAYMVCYGDEGIKHYFNYLAAEYGKSLAHNKTVPIDNLDNTLAEKEAGESALPLGVAGLAPSAIRLIQEMSQAEWELFETLASIGIVGSQGRKAKPDTGVRGAAHHMGVPYAAADRMYRRVRARARSLPDNLFNA